MRGGPNTRALAAQETSAYTMAPKNADQNPATENPFTKDATNQKSRPLITKMNNPRVSTVAGSVRSTISGRISVLTSPSRGRGDERGVNAVHLHRGHEIGEGEQ